MKKMIALFLVFSSTIVHADEFTSAISYLTHDPRVSKGEAEIDTGKVNYLSSKLNFLPKIELNGSYTDQSNLSYNTTTASIAGRLNLFNGGSDYNNLKSALYHTEYNQNVYQTKLLEIELEGASAIFENIEAHKNEELQSQILDLAEKNFNLAQKRFQAGLISKTDALKAEVEFNNQSATSLQSKERYANSMAKINYLFPGLKMPKDWPWFPEKSNLMVKALSKLKSQPVDVSDRPDLKSLHNLQQELAAQKNSTVGSFLPKVNFDLSRGFTDYSPGRTWATTGVLSVTFPLFSGLSDYNTYNSTSNQLLQAEYETRFQTNKSKAEAQALQELLVISLQNAINLERNLSLAKKLYQESLNRFRKGQSSYSDLALDLERYVRAEQLLLSQKAVVHRQSAQFCFAQGLSQKNCMR